MGSPRRRGDYSRIQIVSETEVIIRNHSRGK
jgi:hypothetical protein